MDREMPDDKLLRITWIEHYRFDAKYLAISNESNPNKVVPSRFLLPAGNYFKEDCILTYDSLVVEGPKSLVARYRNRYANRSKLPGSFIVKYQLKFQTDGTSAKLRNQIQRRYFNETKGDFACSGLPRSPFLCQYYGTYVIEAEPYLAARARRENDGYKPRDQRLMKASAPKEGSTEAYVLQVFEDLDGTDLYNYMFSNIRATGDCLRHMVHLVADICEGLVLMHERGIFHGDLKPENAVVVPDKTRSGIEVKGVLIDFDFAAFIHHDRIKRGTPRYLSPEYIRAYCGEAPLAPLGKLGKEFDMWAVGAILWSMIFYPVNKKFYLTSYNSAQLKDPVSSNKVIDALFEEYAYGEFLERRLRSPPAYAPSRLIDITRKLLSFKPSQRLTASEAGRLLRSMATDSECWVGR